MATRTDSPQVTALLDAVEKTFGRPVRTPSDFVLVADRIESRTHEHISDSTIKRLWNPRLGYATVSDRTLNVLARYAGYPHFMGFCRQLAAQGVLESELVSGRHGIRAEDLAIGSLIRIAWLPDRECTLRYLGERQFEAVETQHAKLQPGDTFFCSSFLPGRPLYVDHLCHDGEIYEQYGMGTEHGLTRVEVSDILTTPPPVFATELQQRVYETFSALSIPFGRVDTDPGLTMEDCLHIGARIGVRIVKTLFLCNRQQTEFYLYVTTDDRPFVTRDFCGALGIPRVSFAPADKLWALTGVTVGATTILSAILPQAAPVHLVMDRSVARSEWFACTDGTPTCFVKLSTEDLLRKYLPASGHQLTLID